MADRSPPRASGAEEASAAVRAGAHQKLSAIVASLDSLCKCAVLDGPPQSQQGSARPARGGGQTTMLENAMAAVAQIITEVRHPVHAAACCHAWVVVGCTPPGDSEKMGGTLVFLLVFSLAVDEPTCC